MQIWGCKLKALHRLDTLPPNRITPLHPFHPPPHPRLTFCVDRAPIRANPSWCSWLLLLCARVGRKVSPLGSQPELTRPISSSPQDVTCAPVWRQNQEGERRKHAGFRHIWNLRPSESSEQKEKGGEQEAAEREERKEVRGEWQGRSCWRPAVHDCLCDSHCATALTGVKSTSEPCLWLRKQILCFVNLGWYEQMLLVTDTFFFLFDLFYCWIWNKINFFPV